MRFTLKKRERLHGFKLIEHLFKEGNTFLIYPFKVVWKESSEDTDFPYKFGVSVSKRNFKKAVDRNLLKRRTREAYRKNKSVLYKENQSDEKGINFMVIYISKEILPSNIIESKIILILRRLSRDDEKGIK